MNKGGHPETLVAAQPGNANALKHGVHSPRLIQARAAEIADYVRALQRIALGQDPSGSARDRLAALKELLKLEKKGTTSYIEGASEDDPEVHRRWAEVHRADSLSRLKSLEGKFGLGD